jgi:flagellar biosynthesis/type III secretory pathway protein FliH
MKTNSNDEDDFFGHDDDDDDMAEREARAIQNRLENVAYLEAFEETKEIRLQQGFEAGYQEVYEVAGRLGEQLGRLVAKAKLESLLTATSAEPSSTRLQVQMQAQDVTSRYRVILTRIIRGVPNDQAKELLLNLEQEMQGVLSQNDDHF